MIEGLYNFASKWSEKGAVYVCADIHLGESEDLRQAYPNRPSDEELVKLINSKTGKGSTLIVCGDIGTNLELISKLRANIVLIRGNHDHLAEYYKDVVSEYYEGMLIISPKIILSHEPFITPYMINISGHNHNGPHMQKNLCNVCIDVMNYQPLNLNQFVKSGKLKECENIHQETVNKATERKAKRIKRGQRRQAGLYEDIDIMEAITLFC